MKLRTGQIAKHFGVTPQTIREWVREGKLTAITLPSGQLRFEHPVVEQGDESFVLDYTPRYNAAAIGDLLKRSAPGYGAKLSAYERQQWNKVQKDMKDIEDPNEVLFRSVDFLIFNTPYGNNGRASEFCGMVTAATVDNGFSLASMFSREQLPIVADAVCDFLRKYPLGGDYA